LWGSPGGRGILPAARRRECAPEGREVGTPCWREGRCDRGVVLPGGMRAPRGEKFWQSSSRDGRLVTVDIGNCGGVATMAAQTGSNSCQQCVVWVGAGLWSG
jgi:hypothetical protein